MSPTITYLDDLFYVHNNKFYCKTVLGDKCNIKINTIENITIVKYIPILFICNSIEVWYYILWTCNNKTFTHYLFNRKEISNIIKIVRRYINYINFKGN